MEKPIRVGARWALVWDEEEGDFYVERPPLPGESDTPKHARFLAAIQKLSGDEEFVQRIMDYFNEDYNRWKKERRA